MPVELIAIWELEWKGRQIAVGETFIAEDSDAPLVAILKAAGKIRRVATSASIETSAVAPLMSTDVEPKTTNVDDGFSNQRKR